MNGKTLLLHCNRPGIILSFPFAVQLHSFEEMKTISGIEAIKLAQEVSKVPDGTFTLAFYRHNRATGETSPQLKVLEGCKTRSQMPREQWEIDGDNYFLFQDSEGNPKTAYRILVRYMGFPDDNFKLRKVKWI